MSSLARAAYERIREQIIAGELTPDRPLSEETLAQEMKVSRSPVRDAIRRLASEGLLEQRPKEGTFVRTPGRRELMELFLIRLKLEPYAAAATARQSTPAFARHLEERLDEMKQLVERLKSNMSLDERKALVRRHYAVDQEFHEAILQRSGNRTVCRIVTIVGVLSTSLGTPKHRPDTLVPCFEEAGRAHARIVVAIRRRDAKGAAAAMRQHLLEGRRHARAYFDWLDAQPNSRRSWGGDW